MSLFRSVTVGLLGACLYFVVQLSGAQPAEPAAVEEPVVVSSAIPRVNVVDVAPGVSPVTIPSLVRLWPGERVASVDDRPVDSDLSAGAAIVDAARAKRFIDLAIESRGDRRRVLVLLH